MIELAVVVAQLVEWLLPSPEVRSSNPVVCRLYVTYILLTVLKRQKQGKWCILNKCDRNKKFKV